MSFVTLNVTFVAAVVALVAAPLLSWLAMRADFVDWPGSAPHKNHKQPVPIAGGWILLVTVCLVGLAYGSLNNANIQFFFLPALIIFVFGVLDDWRGLSPLWKLAGQLLASVVMIQSGLKVLLFNYDWLNNLLTIIWMVGITNAYNFVDSMDGLVSGLGGLAAAFFMMVTFDAHQEYLSIFSAIILGACIGIFYLNAPPARFFMGDSGAQFLGFLLAAVAIDYTPVGFERAASWYVPILLMAVPIFDTCLILYSRLRRSKPIFKGAQDHLYHRLVALGMSSNRAVLTMQVAALLLGNLAFIALVLPPIWANLIFTVVLFAGLVAILILDRHAKVF
jgi:UDP-GlcNAc:undecaprenyl-phosphate/decaprenyl-phosphate GlcNAc-1-phosphate transferase